mmetsp:Transcript_222/g.345  ORF Transcript_222/g.345 Transcript_222/m.345 type:complete len:403 (+) Transcript_222:778-1986(+)
MSSVDALLGSTFCAVVLLGPAVLLVAEVIFPSASGALIEVMVVSANSLSVPSFVGVVIEVTLVISVPLALDSLLPFGSSLVIGVMCISPLGDLSPSLREVEAATPVTFSPAVIVAFIAGITFGLSVKLAVAFPVSPPVTGAIISAAAGAFSDDTETGLSFSFSKLGEDTSLTSLLDVVVSETPSSNVTGAIIEDASDVDELSVTLEAVEFEVDFGGSTMGTISAVVFEFTTGVTTGVFIGVDALLAGADVFSFEGVGTTTSGSIAAAMGAATNDSELDSELFVPKSLVALVTGASDAEETEVSEDSTVTSTVAGTGAVSVAVEVSEDVLESFVNGCDSATGAMSSLLFATISDDLAVVSSAVGSVAHSTVTEVDLVQFPLSWTLHFPLYSIGDSVVVANAYT